MQMSATGYVRYDKEWWELWKTAKHVPALDAFAICEWGADVNRIFFFPKKN